MKNAKQAQRAGLMVKDYSEVEKRLNILLMMVDRCWGDLEGIKNELEEIFYDNETGELDEAKFTDSSDLSENAYDEIEECIHDIEYIYEDRLPSIEANLRNSLQMGKHSNCVKGYSQQASIIHDIPMWEYPGR